MKFLPESIENSLIKNFQASGVDLLINNFSFSSGGCINSAGVVETNLGNMFIKWNDKKRYPGMFESEAKGLELLREPGVIKVPKPIFAGEAGSFSYLLMVYIGSSAKSDKFWFTLGQNLAALHHLSSGKFGLDHNNYIGSLNQENTQTDDWINFFINNRLQKQLDLAIQNGKIDKSLSMKFHELYKILPSMLPSNESPSLIHGDLWSGNLMTGSKGEPIIFDPAVYYGHREIELAMTRLFGGFHTEFYDSYNESFPLNPGLAERLTIYQLYPLLVHVNLFGGGYVSQVSHILNRFV